MANEMAKVRQIMAAGYRQRHALSMAKMKERKMPDDTMPKQERSALRAAMEGERGMRAPGYSHGR